jgi:dolichol kinase
VEDAELRTENAEQVMLTGVEIKRKLVHLSTLVIPLGYALTSKETVLTFLIPLSLGLLGVDLLRRYHSGLASLFRKFFIGRVLREKEEHTLIGSTYFLLSSCLTLLLFPKTIAVVSLLILILSDTCAALVGKGMGKLQIFQKTVEGSLAFLVSALLIVWIYPHVDRFAGSLAAAGATVIELLPIHVDDNLSIPLVAGAIMFFLGG